MLNFFLNLILTLRLAYGNLFSYIRCTIHESTNGTNDTFITT